MSRLLGYCKHFAKAQLHGCLFAKQLLVGGDADHELGLYLNELGAAYGALFGVNK